MSRCRNRCGGHLGKCGGAVLERKVLGNDFAEVVPIKRLWRRALKERGCEKSRDMCSRGMSGAGGCTVDVGPSTGVLPHPIVDQRIARPGVEGKNFRALADPCDIGDPADVDDGKRFWQRRGDGSMEQRSERCSLPTSDDVGRAEIGDDIDSEQLRQ